MGSRLKHRLSHIVEKITSTPDGEILDSSIEVKGNSIVFNDKTQFVMMYMDVIGLLKNINTTCTQILVWCAFNCEYNTNEVNLTKFKCKSIEAEYGIKYQTIKNCISKLHKCGAITPLGGGNYRIHPDYFWRGSSDEKKKKLKYILELEYKNKLSK